MPSIRPNSSLRPARVPAAVRSDVRPGTLAMAIGSVLGLAVPGIASAGNSTITTPSDPGRDLGTVITNPGDGNRYQVDSDASRIRNRNAFNSFGDFSLAQGDTVDLMVPDGADNLINLVWDSQALINGVLNSYKDGQIGGRVFFADTHGVVVGASGVLNVGSLAIATPTTGFMNRLLDAGSTGDNAVAALLRGEVPLSPAGVSVLGRINARDDVRIQARAIDASGTIWVAGGSGADRLDSEVAVNTGAGTGTRLVNDGGNILLVAEDSLLVSGTVHAEGGDIVLQADDIVQIQAGARIDSRQVGSSGTLADADASTGDSGDIVVAGRDIAVAGGAMLDAGATGAHEAGDIAIDAAARAKVQTGLAEAHSRVQVDGRLRGGDIALSATSVADSAWDDPDAGLATIAGSAMTDLAQLAGSIIGGTIGYLATDTSAAVALGGSARIEARGDVDLSASTEQAIETVVTGLHGSAQLQNALSIGALYADLDTAAAATVASGADIQAGGTLSVGAATRNTLDVSVTSFATEGTMVATTVAVSTVDAAADASIAAGATLDVGGVQVGALNQSDFSTSAVAYADSEGAVGLAAAVSLQDVSANAVNGADVDTGGDVVVQAASLVDGNYTNATIAEPPSTSATVKQLASDADATAAMRDLMGQGLGKLKGQLGDQGDDATAQVAPFKLGAAVIYTDGRHSADAHLADGTTIDAGGDVVVHAGVVDAGIGMTAGSEIDGSAPDDDNPGSTFALSAAVAITNLEHDAVAEIGDGATVEAEHIGVGSEVVLPMDFSRLQGAVPDFSSFDALLDSLSAAKSLVGNPEELFTSYVSASSKADDLALGGAVSHYHVTNNSRAWVGDGASLTSRADANDGAWETALAGDDRKADWAGSVAVAALTDSRSMHSVGDLALKLERVGAGKDGAAIGGSFNNVVYDTTTVAGIAAGVEVTTDADVVVDAQTRDHVVSLALMGGGGSSIGVDGTMALLDLSSTTLASVSRDATIEAQRLDVDALQDLFTWSVSGALAMSNSLSVGLGVAVHNLDTDTRAYVGDNATDAPDAADGTVAIGDTAGSGAIRVDDLSVQAESKGMSGAVAVAGAVAKSSNPPPADAKPGFVKKLKDSAQSKVDSLRGAAADKFAQLPLLDKVADKVRGEQGAGGGDEKPAEPKFGISVSGSSSVNLVKQGTRAYLDGAQVGGRTPADGVSVGVESVNDTVLASASGSAAITLAKADSSKFSAAIGGAVSYSMVDNDTEAYLSAADLQHANDVAVHALSGGEQTNVALGVSVNKSTDQSTAASVVGSFSIGRSSNDTRAWLAGSTLDGDNGLDVSAYGRTYVNVGAGSLYFGGRAGIGGAFTHAEIADHTEAGIDGGSVSGYDEVKLRALDAARIVAGAAMGGGGSDSNGLAGAVIYNNVDNVTRASIGGGAVVDVDGDLLAQASSTSAVQVFEDRLHAVGTTPGEGVDYRGDALQLDVDGVHYDDPGSSIIAVAGLFQAGKNNVGLSFVGSEVNNSHVVEVADATLDVGGTAGLAAADSTTILGFSIGGGVATSKFAGMGNATANMIGNNTRVLIGADGVDTDISAGAIDASARNASFIGSGAGNVAIGSKAAVGAAVTYNDIGNETGVEATNASLTSSGAVDVAATNDAQIVSAAIAGTAGNSVAISGSFAWSETGNHTLASVGDSRVDASSLSVGAASGSDIFTLSGSVAASNTAAIGAAINIALVEDRTEAELADTRLDIDGGIEVAATGTGTARSLAVAGTVSGNVSVAGASSNSIVDNTIAARASGLSGMAAGSGVRAGSLSVRAENTGEADSLAGAVSGGSSAAVGGALSVNLIGGETSAELSDSVLAVTDEVVVEAVSRATINTLAGTGAASGNVGIAGAATTNVITSTTGARLVDVGLDTTTTTDTLVSAVDSSQVNSLAGSLGFASNVGVGAAVAVNVISNQVSAEVLGGDKNRRYHGRNVEVRAESNGDGAIGDANINTIAAGIGGGGTVGGAASVAVNVIDGSVTAKIADGADVVAEHNVGVTAAREQGINGFAGRLGVGGTAGIGLGTTVNVMDGTTEALVQGADTRVSALGKAAGDRLAVDAGDLADPDAADVSQVQALEDYVAPDLSGSRLEVTGLAVNASSRQHVTSIGASGAVSFNPIGSAAVAAMAGVSVVGGETRALIEDASINQHGGFTAGAGQQVDVRASSHSVGTRFIAGIAGGGGFSGAGALATHVFDASTEAGIDGATLSAEGAVNVHANASQNSLAVAAGLAAGLAGGAGTGVGNVFQASTEAYLRGGDLDAGALAIDAANRNAASLVGGAVAAGAGAIAGTFLVNVSETSTRASLGEAGVDTGVDTDAGVAVRAHTDTGFQGIAVSGAGGGGLAIAGMAQVNVIGNTTEAQLVRADVDAGGDVDVDAQEDLALRAYSGALAIGQGHGVGAGANVSVLGSKVRSAVVDSDVDAGGDVAVTAGADRDVEMLTLTAGVGSSTGIGGAAGLLLSGVGSIGDSGGELGTTFSKLAELGSGDKFDATIVGGSLDQNRLDKLESDSDYDLTGAMDGREDRVIAVVSDSTVAADSVSVIAGNVLATSNLAGGAGVGGVGVGGAFAFTGLYGSPTAAIERTAADKTSRIEAGDVTVRAENRDGNGAAARLEAYAGGAGIVGIGAAVAVARVEQEVAASAAGELDGAGGSLKIEAVDSGSIDVDAIGAAAGAAAVGIVVADARRDSEVSAALAGSADVSGFNGVLVDAAGTGGVSVYGLGAAGGLLAAGTGVGVTAKDETPVTASVGNGASVNTGASGLAVQASVRPDVSAEGLGAAVAGYAAVGAVIVEAASDNRVPAQLGDDVALDGAGGLRVSARLDHAAGGRNVRAKSTAGTGGVFFSANAATAKAGTTSRVVAQTGTDLRLGDGDVTVEATNLTRQEAEALGVSVGGIAAGAVVVDAVSDTTTRASLGDGARHSDPDGMVGRVAVTATGVDDNAARGVAGSGGLIAGNATSVDTDSRATVEATTGDGVELVADDIRVAADHEARYAAQSDSTNAAVVGGSGSHAANRAHADVHAGIGSDSALVSGNGIDVEATNRFSSALDPGDDAVRGAAGGVISGSAASIETRLGGTARADVGDRTSLVSGLDASLAMPGNISVVAATLANTQDNASLSTGGAIDVAAVKAAASADFSNTVVVGTDAWLNSLGYINLGPYTRATINSQALVNTWGLAAVGVASSDVDVDNTQSVTVGTGALLESLRNTYVTAGRDAVGLHDTAISVGSVAEGYVRGLIAIPDASADGTIESYADTVIGAGSQVLSASNVTAGAYTGALAFGVSGVGHGYQLGFIPVTQRDSESDSTTRGNVVLDGDLLAGRYNRLSITIDASGNYSQAEGLPVQASRVSGFRPRDFLANLCQSDAGSDGCKALTALQGSVAAGPVNAWQLGPMYAAGGDVFLHGDSVSGSGSATAQGAPTISVVNNSNYYLLLDEVEVPDYSGGNVRFTGVAGSAGGVAITEEPDDATPSVFIHNAWQGSDGPAIFAMEDIRNIGGLVHLRNDQGSLGQFGTVYAQQQIVEAPNGIVTFSNINADWFSGSNPQSDWRNLMLRPANPDDAAAYITSVVYGGQSLLYRGGPDNRYAGSSIVVYGYCAPHTSYNGCGNGPYGGTGFYQTTMPVVPGRTLSKVINSYDDNLAVANNAGSSSFTGQQIYVRARYIDVNSTIDAGAGTDWSLKVLDDTGLSAWLAGKDAGPAGRYEIPPQYVTTIGADSRLIKAWYDSGEQRIVVDNVNASGGGYVYLDGRIVSTTPHGKIKVSSGFGQVRIDSGIDREVQLQDINVGNGAVGVIEVVDREKGSPTSPYVTWYVSRQGQDAVAYDNRNGATAYDDANAYRIDDASVYNPTSGMRYRWSETAYIKRNYRASGWYWVDAWGNVLDDGQQWATSNAGFYRGAAGGPVFSQTVTGGFTDWTTQGVSYGACDDGKCNFGFPTPPNGGNWNPDRGDDGEYETWWQYQYMLAGYVRLDANVKADNAIAIDFSGADSGLVDVDARGDLLLGGRIWNPGGLTQLTTTATAAGGPGDIVRAGETAMITTQRLEMDAAGGIGIGGLGDMLATLTPGGSLVASASATGVALDVWSDAAVNIVSGDATGGYGDVSLVANGNISGLAGYAADIEGRDIDLESRYGAIGSLADPLQLRAHEITRSDNSIDGGVVSANALNDIALSDQSGDFWLAGAHSEAGDVRLESTSGALLDATLRTSTDGLTEEQIRRIRQNLQLDGSGVADSVAVFEGQVKARYEEYWRLLGLGTVSGGAFVADAGAIALFRGLAEAAAGTTGLDDAQVGAYIAGRYQALVDYFDGVYGGGWQSLAEFAGYDAGFAYQVQAGSQQYADLSRNSVWTDEQLRYAINANALEPSGGTVGAASPTVSGRNITLLADTGIGRLASDLDLEYVRLVAGDLDSEEALALALANTPGDVQMVGPDGEVLPRDQLLALDDDDIRNGAIAYVRVKRTSPLFIEASGRVDGAAGTNAYVQASGDLRVGQLVAGGDARLAASGNLVDADPGNGAAVAAGGDLVLAAGSGSIGTPGTDSVAEAPLEVSIGGRLLSATAGQHVLVREIGGDFVFDSVFANGRVLLDARDGSLLAHGDGVAVDGQRVEFLARDDIGQQGSGTGLGGPLKVHVAGSGLLDGQAGGRIWTSSPGSLGVGRLQAGADLDLAVESGDLHAADLESTGGSVRTSADGDTWAGQGRAADLARLATTGDLEVVDLAAAHAELLAGGDATLTDATVDGVLSVDADGVLRILPAGRIDAGTVVVDAAALAMGSGSVIAAQQRIDVATTGDMDLGQMQVAGTTAGSGVRLAAGGHIAGNGDDVVHIAGGALAAADLDAGTGIGSQAQPLRVSIGLLDGHSAAGDIHLHLPDGGRIGQLLAGAGNVSIDADDALSFARIEAARALAITGTDVSGDQLKSGKEGLDVEATGSIAVVEAASEGDARLASGTSIGVDTLTVAGVLSATAGTDLALDAASVGGNAALQSGAATMLGDAQVQGDLHADAGTDLVATTLEVGGDATLRSDAATRLGTATIGGALSAWAGGAFEAGDLAVGGLSGIEGRTLRIDQGRLGGDANLVSVESTQLGAVSVQGDLDADAGTDLAAHELSVGGDARLASGASTGIDTLTVVGDLSATAGTDLALDAASVGGNVALQSGAATTLGSVQVQGGLEADAGTDLAATTLEVGGDATLRSDAATRLGTATIDGALSAWSGGAFEAGDLAVGGLTGIEGRTLRIDQGRLGSDASLVSVESTQLGVVAVLGNLEVHAGAALAAHELSGGGDAVLVSGASTDIDILTVAGDLSATAGTGLVLDASEVGGNAALQSGAAATLGSMRVLGDFDAEAGTDLAATTLEVDGQATLLAGSDILLGDAATGGILDMRAHRDIVFAQLQGGADIFGTSETRDIIGGSAQAAGRIVFRAPGVIRFDGLRAGTGIELLADLDVTGGSLAAGGDVDVEAGRDIAIDAIEAGRDIRLVVGRTLRLGTLEAGRDLTARAGRDIDFGSLDVVRDLSLASGGDIDGDHLRTGNDAVLEAAGSVTLGEADVGGDLQLAAGGDAGIGRYAVGATTRIDVGGDIGIGQGEGGGTQSLTAGGGIGFDRIAGHASVTMEASGGAIEGAELEAPDAYLSARDRIGLDMARIDSRLNLAAADVQARVEQGEAGTGPLAMVLTGYRDGVARRIVVSVDARDAWIIDRLASLQAELDTTVTDVTITDGWIEESMQLTTPRTRTWMNNRGTTLRPVDVQLTQPEFGFTMRQLAQHTFTDAYAVRYGEGYWVQAPNHLAPHAWTDVDYYAESALRFTFRSLEDHSWDEETGALQAFVAGQNAKEDEDPVGVPAQGAVNVGISQ
ncbi:leukotoxin LktA family filamentous adhesin [Pseudoxanthomonas koreensis]|uniref:leukotoxin LktA family filamentous adhesin n=1 Tax=Pseudoxanthomonas koreensis TaxID=266061 RepID=UPI001391E4E4|nr:leukotoxin LktA family filamentous adhesin [Pseudoxanthomonas koreensis]